MTDIANAAVPARAIAAAFEHSITWEDDIWRADPVDVEEVHAEARAKFFDLLDQVNDGRAQATPARIMLFHGQSGAGKTHLIRALRTAAHSQARAYFGYAQMTPDVANYADYFLRRLINSLEKPYDPHDPTSESGLSRMARMLAEGSPEISDDDLEQLREADLDETALATLVHDLADRIVSSPAFADIDLDGNIIRALLYLQRRDPRIDQRIRQYLQGRELNALNRASVAALDVVSSEGRAFEIIEALGRIMHTLDGAALVFCIDQVEDLRFFDDAEERFQRAVRDLIQIANLLPSAIVIISCLEDFYGHVRGVVAQSYIDRIEKSGPIALLEARTQEEARLILGKRIQRELEVSGDLGGAVDPADYFGKEFFDEFRGLSTRRLLEQAQSWLQARINGGVGRGTDPADVPGTPPNLISTLAAAFGFAGEAPAAAPPHAAQQTALSAAPAPVGAARIDYRELWDRFASAFEAETTSDDGALIDMISASLAIASREWDEITVAIETTEIDEDLPAIDAVITHSTGHAFNARIFLCNRPMQGGGFKRQLDRVLHCMDDRTCFMVRASDFPPNRKNNQAAQSYRRYREAGGRSILIPIPEWERMMTVREFHLHHRGDPGFGDWFRDAKLMSGIDCIAQMLRLDLLGVALAPARGTSAARTATRTELEVVEGSRGDQTRSADARQAPAMMLDPANVSEATRTADASADWTGWSVHGARLTSALGAGVGGDHETEADVDADASTDADTPRVSAMSVDDLISHQPNADNAILVGAELEDPQVVALPKSVMKRHCAVLGGSGSGKTTLALTIIEQLLLQGIPAVLIDRKGDLCSYANPDVWREMSDERSDRSSLRERLGDAIDVAVYTPGRASGRPISITLLPSGINELPGHEQQLLANLSAAALGDMLHLKNSATHQKQSGTLSVALRILGARSSREVMLSDLIDLLEEEDPELTELTQRMDPSGKLRRDLVAQLDSLRFRNAALFDGGGENLRMDSLLGLGGFARPGRTRLSVIYTGFLGDNENILFWVSQFLSEALRFCQRNPNDELQAVVMFDEADLYIPANAKPATAEPLQSLLKRARSAGLGLMLATQSPGDLDYKSRDQITSWFIGRVREDTALRKLKAAFQSESGLDATAVLPGQTVGEFHLVQEGHVRAMKARRSLIQAEQVPFDRIELLAAETKGQDQTQLPLFGTR